MPGQEASLYGDEAEEEDEEEFEIRLDAQQGGEDEEDEDDFEIKLDSAEGAPGLSKPTQAANRYKRPAVQHNIWTRPGADTPSEATAAAPQPPPPPQQPSESTQTTPPKSAPAVPPPRGRPPTFPTYDPNDPGVLPSQATKEGQRVRLPGQTRVTPEEYKEFLGLGHGDVFHLDIDSVVDAPWNTPGADPADFFNYGLNQRSWKDYCAKVKKFQLEFSMQKKIEVYDRDSRPRGGGNSDLPQELAAAVAEQRHLSYGGGFSRKDDGFRERRSHTHSLPDAREQKYLQHSRREDNSSPGAASGSKRPSMPMPDMEGLPLPPFLPSEWSSDRGDGRGRDGDYAPSDKRRRKGD